LLLPPLIQLLRPVLLLLQPVLLLLLLLQLSLLSLLIHLLRALLLLPQTVLLLLLLLPLSLLLQFVLTALLLFARRRSLARAVEGKHRCPECYQGQRGPEAALDHPRIVPRTNHWSSPQFGARVVGAVPLKGAI
jgi:hypothetical protein